MNICKTQWRRDCSQTFNRGITNHVWYRLVNAESILGVLDVHSCTGVAVVSESVLEMTHCLHICLAIGSLLEKSVHGPHHFSYLWIFWWIFYKMQLNTLFTSGIMCLHFTDMLKQYMSQLLRAEHPVKCLEVCCALLRWFSWQLHCVWGLYGVCLFRRAEGCSSVNLDIVYSRPSSSVLSLKKWVNWCIVTFVFMHSGTWSFWKKTVTHTLFFYFVSTFFFFFCGRAATEGPMWE